MPWAAATRQPSIFKGDQTGLTGKHFDGDPKNAR